MLKPELYQKTVDILVDAYFNDTLEHGICQACAVGNIVAYYTNQKKDGKFYCSDYYWSGPVRGAMYPNNDKRGLAQVEATGYSAKELRDIEVSFEECKWSLDEDEHMFNGLMSVIDCLDRIHENNDTSISENSKQRFVKEKVQKFLCFDGWV